MSETLEYMIDVMTRAKAGEQVESIFPPYILHGWLKDDDPIWNWSTVQYRIKPREPRVVYINEVGGHLIGDWYKEPPNPKARKFIEVIDDEK